jgi:hypothetical protein
MGTIGQVDIQEDPAANGESKRPKKRACVFEKPEILKQEQNPSTDHQQTQYNTGLYLSHDVLLL